MKNFAVITLTVLTLVACNDPHIQILKRLQSPSGKYEAVVERVGKSLARGAFQNVSVMRTGVQTTPAGAAQCGDPGTSIFRFNADINQTVSLHWRSDSELIVSVQGEITSKHFGRSVTTCANDESVKVVIE
jgi:hypothetical protein